MVEFVSQAAFARAIGVSRMAICKAVRAGRLQAYNEAGCPVSPDFRGRKFLKLGEAREAFEYNRVRLDNWWLDREA
jgi:biotin operon repressor